MDTYRVFIVEDSGLVRELLAGELSNMEGVTLCGMADNPSEALLGIDRCDPDLVVLDIVLNNGNGFQVLKGMREGNGKAAVMVVTNYAFPHYAKICRELGVKYFFDKSLELEKAIHEIRELACGFNSL